MLQKHPIKGKSVLNAGEEVIRFDLKKKKRLVIYTNRPEFFGRGEKIRTSDPLHPMEVRYQAALRPDETWHYNSVSCNLTCLPFIF